MKLNVLLAKTDYSGVLFKKSISDYVQFFNGKQGDFKGVRKTYAAREGTMDEPAMRGSTEVVTTVTEKLDWFQATNKEHIDNLFSLEASNASGKCQELLERIFPVAVAFDDDEEMEMYIFENGVTKISTNVTRSNYKDYINKYIWGKYRMNGTNYAPAISRITEDFTGNSVSSGGGFLGKLFGSKKEVVKSGDPVFVIFITDGNNSDKSEARKAITEASKQPIFFQFVGIGSASFPFLEELDTMSGRYIDNANFFKAKDITNMSDAVLYSNLMNEFPSWINEAKSKNLVG